MSKGIKSKIVVMIVRQRVSSYHIRKYNINETERKQMAKTKIVNLVVRQRVSSYIRNYNIETERIQMAESVQNSPIQFR